MRKTKEETIFTINRLMDVAKRHFTEKGYANVALEDIVKEAELTRGAVYHHFTNKKGLFLAVFEEIQKEVGIYVEKEAIKSDDMWEQLIHGCRAFLNAASKLENKRILLIDGPAVLGWDTFRMMDQKYSMNSLYEQLMIMQEHGLITSPSIETLTHILSGAMNESVLWITDQPNRDQAIEAVMNVLKTMLSGIKK
ncbi:TetR/AcrR family transcriptional regulator [Ornithinibacillus salinisoli]|uniref:TetR/AcrR family transcriptional regulator n=1 Tax=Ornithinibacillus salinisoli TaxID=1848459 RepID=A0ABW4VVV8_9BACI